MSSPFPQRLAVGLALPFLLLAAGCSTSTVSPEGANESDIVGGRCRYLVDPNDGERSGSAGCSDGEFCAPGGPQASEGATPNMFWGECRTFSELKGAADATFALKAKGATLAQGASPTFRLVPLKAETGPHGGTTFPVAARYIATYPLTAPAGADFAPSVVIELYGTENSAFSAEDFTAFAALDTGITAPREHVLKAPRRVYLALLVENWGSLPSDQYDAFIRSKQGAALEALKQRLAAAPQFANATFGFDYVTTQIVKNYVVVDAGLEQELIAMLTADDAACVYGAPTVCVQYHPFQENLVVSPSYEAADTLPLTPAPQ